MKLRKLTAIIIFILLMFSLSGCKPEESDVSIEEVDLSQAKQTIEAFGIVKSDEFMDIIIDFNSVVTDVLVNEGQHIGMNEPILTLDISQHDAQIADCKSELNIAQLEYEQISMTGDLNTEIDKLKNNINFAESMYLSAVKEYNTNEKLYEEGVISEETYNQSKLNMDDLKNNLENLNFELSKTIDSTNKNTESEIIEKAMQEEYIIQLQNKLKTLENKLTKTYISENQIISQYENAAVYHIGYESGHISDVTKKAFSIANLDSLVIEADVVEEFIKDIKVGAKVRIVPVADRMREYEGSVMYISKMAFNNNGETVIPIKISIDNNDSFLLPNYNVDVYID